MRMYESITDAIIAEMERGAVPWVRPWKTNRYSKTNVMPANAVTGRSYSGINIPILWASADGNGYPTHAWMTFKQALDHKAHVRKGERGTHVVFTKTLKVDEEDEKSERRSMLREYVVFNVAQIEGFSLAEKPLPPEPERLAAVEAFVAATQADIRLGGDKACFVPSHDFIAMPHASSFTSIALFHAVELHELGHYAEFRIMPRRLSSSLLFQREDAPSFGIIPEASRTAGFDPKGTLAPPNCDPLETRRAWGVMRDSFRE